MCLTFSLYARVTHSSHDSHAIQLARRSGFLYEISNAATELSRLQVTLYQPLVASQDLVSRGPLKFHQGGHNHRSISRKGETGTSFQNIVGVYKTKCTDTRFQTGLCDAVPCWV